MQGKIIGNISNQYKIEVNNKIYIATARGKFKKDEIVPVVGDEVEIELLNEDEAVINTILDRKNYTKRPKIANISQIAFIISTKNPKPDLLMLDKQLAYAEMLGIQSIIVINKIDLSEKYQEIKHIYENAGYKVICTSARDLVGIDELKEAIINNTTAFSGNSGVGKSSLLNAVFQKNLVEEGEISSKNKKGKNTTTDVKMHKLQDNTYIADTPGFSSFELTELESKDLATYFREFKKEVAKCEFVGCTHIKEQNCGIKEAVESKRASIERYENYVKIYEELKQKEARKYK